MSTAKFIHQLKVQPHKSAAVWVAICWTFADIHYSFFYLTILYSRLAFKVNSYSIERLWWIFSISDWMSVGNTLIPDVKISTLSFKVPMRVLKIFICQWNLQFPLSPVFPDWTDASTFSCFMHFESSFIDYDSCYDVLS